MDEKTITGEAQLGSLLKSRRQELKITQKQLAEFCDLSHNGISQIELGEKSARLSTLLKLGKMLGFKIVLELEE